MSLAELVELYRARFCASQQQQGGEAIPPPEHLAARTRELQDSTGQYDGIMFQQCGGGRRIVRKRIGGA